MKYQITVRKCAILLVFMLAFFLSKSQSSRTSDFSPAKLSTRYSAIKSSGTCSDSIHFPFSRIKITDSRFDTSKVGFVLAPVGYSNKRIFQQLTLRNGLASTLENYYNKYYSNALADNDLSLHIFIKKFWMSTADDSKHQANGTSVRIPVKAKIYIKWELYLSKEDQFLAFRRIDTILEAENNHILWGETAKEKINLIFNSLIEQFRYDKAAALFDEKPKRSLQEIQTLNAQRLLLPILSDSVIKEGCFMSFAEFKNNQPSVTHFIQKFMHYRGTNKEEYVVDQNGAPIENYWAYQYNGNTKTNRYGNDKMYRCGNTFEYFVKVRVARSRRPGDIIVDNYAVYWIPYQIDMETGNSY